MNYSIVFALIVLLNLCSAAPQQQQQHLTVEREHRSEAMTAAAVNSGIQVATGFISIFQTMLNNFWTTLPTIVNLFASPAGASVPGAPAVPGVPGVPGAGGMANHLQNPLNLANGQYGGPIRQMQSTADKATSNELVEIIDDNIESLGNNVRVWEIRGQGARG